MHAYRRFVQTEMDKRGWTAADLQRSSGLTKQNLSRILRDEREQLQQRPDTETVNALARAFGVSDELVLSHVAEAMGLPTNRVEVAAAADLSNEELLRILAERLNRGGTHEPAQDPEAAQPAPDRDDVAGPAVSHGATTGPVDTNLGRSGAGADAYHRQRGQTSEGSARADYVFPESQRTDDGTAEDRPWEKDEYGLAAKRGRNRGREARQRQDRDGEGGGA